MILASSARVGDPAASTRSGSSPTWSSTSRWRPTGPTPGAWRASPATWRPRSLPFAIPDPRPPSVDQAVRRWTGLARVEVLDDDLCPRFTARVLLDVSVAASPAWIARRLTLAGMRPINNVVDASNYVMLELGQPTHPYDLDRVPGGVLRVRAATPG